MIEDASSADKAEAGTRHPHVETSAFGGGRPAGASTGTSAGSRTATHGAGAETAAENQNENAEATPAEAGSTEAGAVAEAAVGTSGAEIAEAAAHPGGRRETVREAGKEWMKRTRIGDSEPTPGQEERTQERPNRPNPSRYPWKTAKECHVTRNMKEVRLGVSGATSLRR